MKIIKKTIILSSKDNRLKPQMVLELENKNDMIFGTLKSFGTTYKENLLLGIKSGTTIVKQNIKFTDKKCQFKLASPLDLNSEVSCVMVDTSTEFEPILWGNAKNESPKNIIASLKESVTKLSQKSIQTISCNQKVEQNNNKSASNFGENLSNCKNATADNKNINFCETKSGALNYYDKNLGNADVALASVPLEMVDNESAFSPSPNLFEMKDEELDEVIDKNLESHSFYDLISDQIDELFSRYPREKNLEALVEDSMWCKIDSDTEGRYYVVGIIKNDGDIKYICYGVPGSYNVEPPRELRGYSQWLPTDPQNPYNCGYWVMYQDSDTGENVKLG